MARMLNKTSLPNHSNEWVRVLCIVVGSEANKVPLDKGSGEKELADQWLTSKE